MTRLIKLYRAFWQLADPKIWIASTVPIAVGTALAYNMTGRFSFFWLLLTAASIYLIEIGKNALNEYADYLSGADRFVEAAHRTPFSGGKKTIIDGLLTLRQTAIIAAATLAPALLLALYIAWRRAPLALPFVLGGFFFAVFYSIGPLKLAYRGLGELAVGLTFGPLILCATYLVQARTLSVAALLVSLPIGLLVTNILWINQYPDLEADQKAGKLNWVVRLGRRKGLAVFAGLYLAAYLLMIVIAVHLASIFWLLPLISIPLPLRALKVARAYYNEIPQLVESNLKTVQTYQLTGAAMVAAALLSTLL